MGVAVGRDQTRPCGIRFGSLVFLELQKLGGKGLLGLGFKKVCLVCFYSVILSRASIANAGPESSRNAGSNADCWAVAEITALAFGKFKTVTLM